MSLSVHRVGVDDAAVRALDAQVQAYYTQTYGGPDGTSMPVESFVAPNGAFYVGYLGTEAVAMGGWRFTTPQAGLPGRRPAEIKRMYVVPSGRRQGFARAMLVRLEQSALAAGADAVVLETGPAQTDAIELYRTSGYVPVAAFGEYADEPGTLHLGRVLPPGLAREEPICG